MGESSVLEAETADNLPLNVANFPTCQTNYSSLS